jgi:hypothetical protein
VATELVSGDTPELADVLPLLRQLARSQENVVLYELMLHARGNTDLRERLAPIIKSQRALAYQIGASHPALQTLPQPVVQAAVSLLVLAFDGEALVHTVCPDPALDEARLQLLLAAARLATPRRASS